MTIAHGLHGTASTIHIGYYPQHITQHFKTYLRPSLYIVMQKAVILNTSL